MNDKNMSSLKPIISWTPSLYDRISNQYDRLARWFFPIGDLGRERVVSDLEPGQILDIACGTGSLLEKAHQSGLACIGIDTSRGMLLETRKKVPSADLVQASFYALPFSDNQFEYVVETNAVSGADINPGQVLHEMLRVCRDEGEIRLGDYGSSRQDGIWIRILIKIGILLGDYPHNYQELFHALGYEAQFEDLGWGGMYQYIRVVKRLEGGESHPS
jgi:ubiquinone/menaquinone biosynthesis C-methylase UbiE